jgi:hypothetical protein
MIAIILQKPDDARARPGDYFKEQRRYDSIFGSQSIQLPVYVRWIGLLRRIEEYLSANRIRSADAKKSNFIWQLIFLVNLYGSPDISGRECTFYRRPRFGNSPYRAGEAEAQATAQSERTRPWLLANRFQAISQASMMSARLENTELASQ